MFSSFPKVIFVMMHMAPLAPLAFVPGNALPMTAASWTVMAVMAAHQLASRLGELQYRLGHSILLPYNMTLWFGRWWPLAGCCWDVLARLVYSVHQFLRQQETWKMPTAEGKWELEVAVVSKKLIRQQKTLLPMSPASLPRVDHEPEIHHTSCSLLKLDPMDSCSFGTHRIMEDLALVNVDYERCFVLILHSYREKHRIYKKQVPKLI